MSENSDSNKSPLPAATSKNQHEWRDYCGQLLTEIENLRTEVIELRAQRRAYASMIPVPDEVKKLAEMSAEELQTMCDQMITTPTIQELIAEHAKSLRK